MRAISIFAAACFAAACTASDAKAQVPVKIGVLNDQSGLYADLGGQGSVWAAKKAVEDFGAAAKGLKVDVIFADHQNKADVGTSIARQWYDVDGVDVILDVPNSGVALAVNTVTKEKNKVFINSGAATSDLTGKACTPNTVHWTYDTYALANGTGKAIVKTGADTWFFLTADYSFGKMLERDTSKVVVDNGGKVVGSVKVPLNNADFSSFLLQAQSSKAKIVGLANAGGDTINSIKQASEYGIVEGGQKLAGLLIFLTDVHSLGLKTAQGLTLTEAWYWDQTDANRKFADSFAAANGGKRPTMVQAGVYAGTLHYLKAVEALKSAKDGAAVVAKMKEIPTDDPLFGKGEVRVDGRTIHPMYLYEVKKPSESKGPWDYYTLKAIIPASEAFRPLGESQCPLVAALASLAAAKPPVAAAPPPAPSLAPAVAAAPARPALAAETRVALVIGNSSYSSVPRLENPKRDAKAIAAALRSSGFSKVIEASDLTREQLLAAVRAFAAEADRADWAMVYFAGHGLEIGGMNYIIPVDAKLLSDRDVEFEALPLNTLLRSLEGARKLRLVVLDACRNNPFASQMKMASAGRSVGRGLGRVEPDAGTLVVYAARDGQIAQDGDGANSPFATALIRRMATPGVEIDKMLRLVSDDVMAFTGRKQEPYTYGRLSGQEDYFFIAPK